MDAWDRALLRGAARVRLLGAVAPLEGEVERARLCAAFEAGRDAAPRWTYAKEDADAAFDLTSLVSELEGTRTEDPLFPLYLARARELLLEARIAACVGTPRLGALARERFAVPAADAEAAAGLARAWFALPDEPPAGPLRTSDGPEPESLASRMREALGRQRVPFVVDVRRDLASLAATGERAVFVAAGRTLADEDVRRTVVHEVEAHVLPRARAQLLPRAIFRAGTARGADDQEGLALVLEERHGFLGNRRKRELAVRHDAVTRMDAGASFAECVRGLMRDRSVSPRDAVFIAERVYRGGDGRSAGLGRERVYLASYARVRAHLAAHPEDERVLSSGQVALEAAPALRLSC